MAETTQPETSLRDKLNAILEVGRFNPAFAATIVLFGLVAAVLEGVGLTFIIPIIEIVQADDPVAEAEGLTAVFVVVYQQVGIPFSLGYVIAGVAFVMTVRYTMGFLVAWFRDILTFRYRQELQLRGFDNAIDARIEYFDAEGTDDILNAIITESQEASRTITHVVTILETAFLTLVYLLIAMYISPGLTLVSVVVLALITVVLRSAIEPGYDIGDRVAEANERRQEAAQAGMLGIRDIRIYSLADETFEKFADAVETYTHNKIKLSRNEEGINNFYNLAVAVFVFGLIYVALVFANLSFGELGLFLFLMFQLGPKVSGLNKQLYRLENRLPHLVRTQRFIAELEATQEPEGGSAPVPASVETLTFDDVWFSYNGDDVVLRGVDFTVRKGEFVGFVGQSGAGKSTIVSLIARFYEPDSGQILANGAGIEEMDPTEWRDRIAIVRQSPFIFNRTLRENLTVGNRKATDAEIDRAVEIARVDEFLGDLPRGYETVLGDEGVRLSGGQKQRVALARALLSEAELLILDEATSDLDSSLEKEVQREIESMDREYAIITIAHRLSTVENADRIYTMENGRISERGPHSELIEAGGTYAELYSIQVRG